MARRRLKQVTDLYTVGKVAVLRDGTPIWMQALNPFEADAARQEATIAKARLVLALKEFGSDEQSQVRLFFFEDGIDGAVRRLVEARLGEEMPKVITRMRANPDWTERLDILERGLDDLAANPTEAEVALLEKLSVEYTEHVRDALTSEREFLERKYEDETEEVLWEDYLDFYLSRRGQEVQVAEYQLHKVLFGARWCEAEQSEDGRWDHSNCEGHDDRIYADKEAVRRAPTELIQTLMEAADDIELTVREAGNSDRQRSSFDSSPLPDAGEESTASTPSATRVEPLGTSSQPSPMP